MELTCVGELHVATEENQTYCTPSEGTFVAFSFPLGSGLLTFRGTGVSKSALRFAVPLRLGRAFGVSSSSLRDVSRGSNAPAMLLAFQTHLHYWQHAV
jgi:hypothetical protein